MIVWSRLSGYRRVLRGVAGGELGGFGRDSWHVAVWQAAVSAADLAQIALVTHALGLKEYGRLALVIALVVLVGQFFDVRVGSAATTFGARRLERSVADARGIFQLSFLIDLATGIVGFAVVAAISPLVGPGLVGDGGGALILLYALTLLAGTVEESSITVLRLLGRFRLVATYTMVLEVARVALVAAALAGFGTLTAVVLALLAYKVMAGVTNVSAAAVAFRRASQGERLTRPALATVREERREFLRMVFHTNVVSYARIAQTQLPTIVIGALAGATQVGLYKVGMAAATMVGRLADPPYVALLPRISRLWVAGRRDDVGRLVRRATAVSVPVMAAACAALILLHAPVLRLLGGGDEALDATSVLVLGSIAQGINGALFWNVGVMYAAGRSKTVSNVALLGLALQLLLLPLVVSLDAAGAALALLVSMTVTNVLLAFFALRALHDPPRARPTLERPPAPAIEPPGRVP